MLRLPSFSLDARLNIHAAVFARAIEHSILAILAHPASLNSGINLIQRMPELLGHFDSTVVTATTAIGRALASTIATSAGVDNFPEALYQGYR